MIEYRCHECNAVLRTGDEKALTWEVCPECSRGNVVPRNPGAPESVAAAGAHAGRPEVVGAGDPEEKKLWREIGRSSRAMAVVTWGTVAIAIVMILRLVVSLIRIFLPH
jgi:hypothetical protein